MIRMEATAFTNDAHPTAAGTVAHEGIVAADPAVLPLGSRIRIARAGIYNGVYTVTDTGNKINGRHIDIYIADRAAAKEFGKKIVLVRLLRTGTGKSQARAEDIPAGAPTSPGTR
jgi:3D (Asp-Asp-Asp) domain-containing protein